MPQHPGTETTRTNFKYNTITKDLRRWKNIYVTILPHSQLVVNHILHCLRVTKVKWLYFMCDNYSHKHSERSCRVYTLTNTPGWSTLGQWRSLTQALETDVVYMSTCLVIHNVLGQKAHVWCRASIRVGSVGTIAAISGFGHTGLKRIKTKKKKTKQTEQSQDSKSVILKTPYGHPQRSLF